MTYRAVIVEDDLLSFQVLSDLIEDEFEQIEIVAHFATVKAATEGLLRLKIDLVFLDMQLTDGLGFDLLTGLKSIDFEVIITTMHDSYMLEAIKHSAIDYLMKPLEKKGLREAIERFENRIVKKGATTKPAQAKTNKLVIPSQDGLLLIDIEEIIRLESDGAYTHLYLMNGQKHMTSKNLGFYESQLVSHAFFRVHHGHLINLIHLKNYVRAEGGQAVMSDDSLVNVSRRRKEDFLRAIGA
ncbi:MAG: two-component system LytT family response regulator [Cryomorphaceae bacterium]|jgi:two-component system LytT family response regulator